MPFDMSITARTNDVSTSSAIVGVVSSASAARFASAANVAVASSVLVAVAKRQHDMDTAIAAGTQRIELLNSLHKHRAKMEALADLAHAQATIGEFSVARNLFEESLELAKELESLSGQLVARWGLADLAEIAEDYQSAMLVLSDCLHAYMAENQPTPAAVKQRIQDLTALKANVRREDA